MKIALVQQDSVLADLISFRLELLGHTVDIKSNVEAAIEPVEGEPLHLLILDIGQSSLAGTDSIRLVRRKHAASKLPILALSVDTDMSLVEQAYRAGANDYLILPFDPSILQKKTDALLLESQHAQSIEG